MAEPFGPIILSWLPNTEPDLATYYLYVGRASGVYNVPGSPINVGLVTTYTYTPNDGGFWYFIVKAQNTSGGLSDASNEIAVEFLYPLATPTFTRTIYRVDYR